MINSMLKIIDENENCFNSFLDKEIGSHFHQFISNRTVFDIIDIISMNCIENYENKDITFENLEKYEMYICRFKEISEDADQEFNQNFDKTINKEIKKHCFLIGEIKEKITFLLNTKLFPNTQKSDIPFLVHKIVRNSAVYQKKLKEYVNSCQELARPIIGSNSSIIFSNRFYGLFHFNCFVSHQLQLNKYDSLMYDFIFSNRSILLEKEFELSKFWRDIIHHNRSKFEEGVAEFRDIFGENSNPFEKLIHIYYVTNNFVRFQDELMPPYEYMSSLMILLIIYANPLRLISNSLFILKYVDLSNDDVISKKLYGTCAFLHDCTKYLVSLLNEQAFDVDYLLNGENDQNNEKEKTQKKFKGFHKKKI